jgi:sugar-specific transcriptional regulator TrmB
MCKEEIIRVLREGIKGIYEIRQEFDSEFSEVKEKVKRIEYADCENTEDEEKWVVEKMDMLSEEIQNVLEKAINEFKEHVEVN